MTTVHPVSVQYVKLLHYIVCGILIKTHIIAEQGHSLTSGVGSYIAQINVKIYITFKGECSVFKKQIIMDENDALSEYNEIPLCHNRTNGAVYSKIYFIVEICSAH